MYVLPIVSFVIFSEYRGIKKPTSPALKSIRQRLKRCFGMVAKEMFRYGGDQLLLQGGHHPELGLSFYTGIFSELKKLYPQVKLHALGPPEVAHITKLEGMTHTEVLKALKDSGLDTLPGAGAEILSDRVRRMISKGKCTGREWLDVMRAAHQLNITTSATMMFGHIETLQERFEHLVTGAI